MIKVNALSRSYGKVLAVNKVSFEIGPTEIVGLLGQNGAGKTTILKILTGYLEPTAGAVTINELDVCEERRRIQAEIGYLPENAPLYPDMTVLDYLDYVATLRGVPEEKKQDRIINAIKKTRIVDVAQSLIRTLSRGYRQRVGVAQTILNSPSILILDEPTNGLDPSQIMEMRSLIRELAETATVLISTHILQEVEALCHRVIILNKGCLALDARLDTMQAADKLVVTVDKGLEEHTALLEKFELKILDCRKKSGQNRYTLSGQPDKLQSLTPSLLEALLAAGCKIYAVHPIERDLETIFREIIAGESQLLPEKIPEEVPAGRAPVAAQPSGQAADAQSSPQERPLVPGGEGGSSETHS